MDRDSSRCSAPSPVHLCIDGHDYGMGTADFADQLMKMRHEKDTVGLQRPGNPTPASSSRGAGSRRRQEHAARTCVRQSSMYSDRPRRSRRNPGRAVKKDVAEVSSSVIGPTIPDTSKFKAQSLNDSPSTLDSTDGAVVCLGDMGSAEHNSTTDGLLACQKLLSPLDTSSGQPDSAIIEPSAAVEAVSPKSEGLLELEEYLKEHTFDTIEDAFEFLWNNQKDTLAAMYPQSSLGNYEFGSESEIAPEQEEARSVPASEQAPSVPEQGQSSEASYEEIAQNGKKWMTEEVMVAFNKYIEDKEDVEDIQYEFDELGHQCFSVKSYHEIFHHFNFTIKMKVNGSADWTSALFFAEVKEIFRRKFYFCSPLELYENGHCYACKKQGMDDLRHPIIGVYDRGNPDIESPFMYGSEADDFGFMYYESDEE